MKKRIFAVLLSFLMAFVMPIEGLGLSDLPLSASYSLRDFSNGEVFVEYTDGSSTVLSFSDEENLKNVLSALSKDDAVLSYQPNFSYETTALPVNDPLDSQQWALDNDGSFVMKEEENRYPVYDKPFEMPSAPGQWNMPDNFGYRGGRNNIRHFSSYPSYSTNQISAVSGIDIGAEEAWSVYTGSGSDVIIALIDTGVDSNHEDLQNVLWTNEDEIAGNGIDDDGNGYIDDVSGWNFYNNNNRNYVSSTDDSHGTHCAGTILANANNGTGIAGIVRSDKVKIMSLKALGGSDGSGTTSSIIKAIQYAEANGASICNLSLGSTANDQALYRAIANSGMLFVVAAGNDSANTDDIPCYPASYDLDNIISVANLNYNGTLHSSSNYGTFSVDIAAPGSYILSTTPNNGYSYMTGTSMAAPMVTAAAAMIYSNYSGITLADVKEILLSSAQKRDSLKGNVYSGGMLDLASAMRYDISTLSHETWDTAEKTVENTPEMTIPKPQQQPNFGGNRPIVQPGSHYTQPAIRIDLGIFMRRVF